MNRILAALLLLALNLPASAEVWQARYGVAETFDFKLYNADGTLDVDEADGGTEVSVSCNEGAETTATNDFVDEGTFYSIALTAAEMQCERIAVVVAATTTEVFFIQTSANASAMTPSYEANVGTITDGAIVAADFSTTAGAYYHFGIIDQGTAQAATGTTLQLRSAAAFADDEIIGATCVITGGSAGVGQARAITDYDSTTDTATVATWTTTPTGTITYACFGTAAASSVAADVWANATRTLTAIDEDSTTLDLNATAVGSVAGAVGSVTGAVGSVTGAVGSVTGNVGGNVTGSVGSVVNLEQAALADAAVINCTTNTANFAGSTTTVACILTDRDAGAITAASNDLEGRELLILSGAQIYEGRFITDSTWDGANSELRLTLSRALPATLADAVTAIIR